MAKISENCQLISKLSQDDPECNYVNKMMEMSAEVLRDLHRTGQTFVSLHGVVPAYRLPPGYDYGNMNDMPSATKICNANKIAINNQNSSSTFRMETNEHETDLTEIGKIESVLNDILYDEDDYHDESTSIVDNTEDLSRLLFNTLDACAKKVPSLDNMQIFQKQITYLVNPKECTDNETFGDTDISSKISPKNLLQLLELLSVSTYKKNLASSFQTICDLVKANTKNNKRKAAEENIVEKSVTPPKLPKLSKVNEKKKENTPESHYQFNFNKSVLEITFGVIPDLSVDMREKLRAAMKERTVKEAPMVKTVNDEPMDVTIPKPKDVAQDSLPFVKSDCLSKNDIKIVENNATSTVPESLPNNISNDIIQNPVKKPEAVAKPIFTQSTNFSNYNSNPKIAVVAGKVNKTQSNWPDKSDTSHNADKSTALSQPPSTYQKPRNVTRPQAHRDSKDNETEEPKVVQSLMAIQRMRTSYKNDFIARMRNFDNDKWSKEVDSLKRKALDCNGQLDYAPHIMVYIRKKLFYNYSLEVKSQYETSHRTYLENAAMIKDSCKTITLIYNEQEELIKDKSSTRLWNIKLVKHFTVIMCHRLSAILQYRAFRNVAEDCKKVHETLLRDGVINHDHKNTENNIINKPQPQNSPYSNLPSYSPSQSALNNNPSQANINAISIGADRWIEVQRYIAQTNIINSSYNDWILAEKCHASYCNRSVRHEESWRDFERKIIEKTGGVVLTSSDESVPFVIKYLEGYINFMNEFMKHSL